MSGKIEISRELADRIEQALLIGLHESSPIVEEWRTLLAAQVVERQPIGHVSYIGGNFFRVRCLYPPALESPIYAEQPAPVAVVLPSREVMRDLIAEVVGGDTYDCVRVWSAWGVGTMSEDDFVPFVEQDERLYELADACLDKVKELNQ